MKDSSQLAFYKSLGARIRELRGGKMSQEQLAKAANLSRTSMVNIESGRQKLLVHNLFQISKALGVRSTELLSDLEPPEQGIPVIDVSGEEAAWVQRSVKKAIQAQIPHDKTKLIAETAAALLNEAGITRPPVDVKKLAQNQGALVVEEPNDEQTSGFIFRAAGSPPVIGVNASHPLTRKRFTIAHELAHLLLHFRSGVHVDYAVVKMRDARAGEGTNEDEMEANRFAADLLMPRSFLEADLKTMGPIHADDDVAMAVLAKQYGVSQQAMAIRLSSLGLICM